MILDQLVAGHEEEEQTARALKVRKMVSGVSHRALRLYFVATFESADEKKSKNSVWGPDSQLEHNAPIDGCVLSQVYIALDSGSCVCRAKHRFPS